MYYSENKSKWKHYKPRYSATILVDNGHYVTEMMKLTAVTEGCIDESLKNKYEAANKILNSWIE